MGIRKTHFPCRKPFGAIRLSHFFANPVVPRESFSTRCERPQKSGCGRLLLTSPHTHVQAAASCRSYQVFDLFDTYSKHSPDFRDVHSSSLGSSRIASGFVYFAARCGIPSPGKKRPTSSAYSCSNEDHRWAGGGGRGEEKEREAFGFRLPCSCGPEKRYGESASESVGFDIPAPL